MTRDIRVWPKLTLLVDEHSYVTYIASELPSNYMLRVLGGKVNEHMMGIFFASASLSGAFGGLLAYGIEMMEGLFGQKASLETASFLTPAEREFAVARLKFVPKLNHKTLALKVDEAQADSLSSSHRADADARATVEDKTALTPHDLTRFVIQKPLQLLNPDGRVGLETDVILPVEKF
ncbi:hypothetical protein KEM48_006848 [Puccinia striiformis f. sp. tritici PST-130]|nr:hypothetical protein KEM48_006848 [Puccinia striiformis f. sp. tritici PST-130]